MVRFRPEAPKKYADVAHLVERHLAKVEVAGSSPVIRSIEKEGAVKKQPEKTRRHITERIDGYVPFVV